jgi:hypothetical protein
MGNSKGNYYSTTENRMAAFDKLPKSAREALANAAFSWAPQPIVTRWKRGDRGYKTGPSIAKLIPKWDEDKHAKDVKKGIVP